MPYAKQSGTSYVKKFALRRAAIRKRLIEEDSPRQCSKKLPEGCNSTSEPATWPITSQFGKHNAASDGLRPECKKCQAVIDSLRRRKRTIKERSQIRNAAKQRRSTALTLSRKKWLSWAEVRAFFRVKPNTLRYWINNGLFLPNDLRFPRPIKASNGKRLWSYRRLMWFRGELDRRREEIRAALNSAGWTMEVIRAEVKRKREYWQAWEPRKPTWRGRA